jgi:methionyl-tRNA formyltransferase
VVNEDALRIVFFGTPRFAVPTLAGLLASHHPVVAVVTQPDRPRGRGQRVVEGPVKALARSHSLPVLQPERLKTPEFVQALVDCAPDLGVVAAYGKILPEEVLDVPRLGLINVHASLLPRWRGAAPVERAVVAGDTQTGVTIMRVVRALDAGGMFASIARPIGADETAEQVEDDLSRLGADLLLQVVDTLASGRAVQTPQDESQVTYAPRLSKEEGLIDWTQPAVAVHNKVRGLQPWPHAYSYLHGARFIFLRTTVGADTVPREPGTVVEASGDALRIAAGSGAVRVLQIQPEGRRPMAAREFLAGHRLAPGDRFGPPDAS